MALLNIAGGAAQGYVRGDQDIQRRREFEALQNQRKRVEQQQKLDDELAATLKQVRPAGDYDQYSAAEAPGGEGADTGVPRAPTKTRVKRSVGDVAREQAGVMGRGGRLQDIQAQATLNQQAYAADAADIAARQAKKQEVLTTAGQLLGTGNTIAAARHLQQGYKEHVPDGHELVFEQRGGQMHWGVIGPDGSYLEPPEPVTPESVKKRIAQGVDMLTPENMYKREDLGLKAKDVGAHETTAQAAAKNAATAAAKMVYETTGDYAKAELAYKQALEKATLAHGRYFDAAAEHQRDSTTGGKFGATQTMTNDKGETLFYTPIRGKDGKLTWQQELLPPGVRPMKRAQEMNDFQKSRLAKLDELDQANFFVDKGTKKVNHALRNQWIKDNQLTGLFSDGNDPFAAAALKAGDPDAPGAAGNKGSPEDLKALEKKAAERAARNAAVKTPTNPRVKAQAEEAERLRKERLARNAAVPG